MRITRLPILYHILFWLAYFTFNWIRWGSFYGDYIFSLKTNLVEFPIHIIIVYFNIFYLMPRLIPERISWYIFLLFVSILAITFAKIILTYLFVTTEIYIEAGRVESNLLAFNYVLSACVGEFYIVGTTTGIKITIDWIHTKTKTTELEKTNLETELNFLKSQIQPHFFFNTLNNLYSLTLDKSDKAPETVLKLSELMSYVIYDAKQKRVLLVNEAKHIQNYLDLERLRFGDSIEINFSISGDIEGKIIPPVLLLPFIENSFKHGVKVNQPLIDIAIKVEHNTLYFSTYNKKSNDSCIDNELQSDKHGVGLENTMRRLNLIYDNTFSLDINDDEEYYSIALKIPLE